MFRIECRLVQVDTGKLVTDDMIAGHLYRIAKEAIGNSARHGDAKRVDVRLVGSPDRLLEITDNGHGFDPDRSQVSSGMGLRPMQYRAGIFGC